MAGWTPYVLTYLFGIATPVFFVRQLLRKRDDGGACIMEVILAALLVLVIFTLWLGLR